MDVVAFHEVGLRAGQTINYEVTGSATASYSCNGRTEVVAGPVGSAKSFTADASGEISEVIAVQPPAPRAGMCTANIPAGYGALVIRRCICSTAATRSGKTCRA